MNTELLKELGFEKVVTTLDKKLELKRKLMVAYEHYRFVTPEICDRFQKALKMKSYYIKKDGKWVKGTEKDLDRSKFQAEAVKYDTLAFTPIKEYGEIPPVEVLEKIKEAKDRGIFDRFEVAKIESVVKVEDPIVFGMINGCDDRFFIAQWDNDVSINDILEESEG